MGYLYLFYMILHSSSVEAEKAVSRCWWWWCCRDHKRPLVYHSDCRAPSTAQFSRTGHLTTADRCQCMMSAGGGGGGVVEITRACTWETRRVACTCGTWQISRVAVSSTTGCVMTALTAASRAESSSRSPSDAITAAAVDSCSARGQCYTPCQPLGWRFVTVSCTT